MDNEKSDADDRHLAALFGEAWDNSSVNQERARKWWKISLEIHSGKRMPEKRTETAIGDDFIRKMGRSGGSR